MLQVSEALRHQVAQFSPTALLQEILVCPSGSWQGFEHLTVAVARHGDESQTKVPTEPQAARLLLDADKEFASITVALPPLQRVLLNARALRPRWLAAPIYAEILAPFDDLCQKETGLSISKIFSELSHAKAGLIATSSDVVRVLEASAHHWRDLTTHKAAFECAVVDVDDNKLLLVGQKIADVVYRHLCDSFRAADPDAYAKRKGTALEKTAHRILSEFAPDWQWYNQYKVGENERDHIGLHPEAGIVAETKSVSMRSSTVVNNIEHAKRDLRDLQKAHHQVSGALEVLRNGGSIGTESGPVIVKAKPYALGLIVTDEPSSAYLRTVANEYLPGEWTGDAPHLLSIVDLDLLCRWSGTPAVLFDYVSSLRAAPNLRWNDEAECMLAYGTEPALNMAKAGFNIDLRGFDWDRIHAQGIESVRPPWLRRLNDIREQEKRGRMRVAMRLLDQDKRVMTRWARDSRSTSTGSFQVGDLRITEQASE